MQASPDVAVNRYADAYIQPEYDQLQPFNTARRFGRKGTKDNPVPTLTHFNAQFTQRGEPLNPAAHWDLLDIHQGSGLSRTELYWTVYVATGFQSGGGADGDPSFDGLTGQKWGFGLSVNRAQAPNTGLSKSILFVETGRDLIDFADPLANPYSITAEILLARNAVHEVGHQFGLVVRRPPLKDDHRSGGNLMDHEPGLFHDAIFVFDPQEVADLRTARRSP